MKKVTIIIKILSVLAIVSFITYLITKSTAFMFCGGLFLLTASILSIVNSKSKSKK